MMDRFWVKVNKTDDCWVWIGGKTSNGYGVFWTGERTTVAHRIVYEAQIGQIPEGLDIDHLCRNRACVNPEHLEPVTRQENVKRGLAPQINAQLQKNKTHCPKGHEYNQENTYIRKDRPNERGCRKCRKISVYKFNKVVVKESE